MTRYFPDLMGFSCADFANFMRASEAGVDKSPPLAMVVHLQFKSGIFHIGIDHHINIVIVQFLAVQEKGQAM